MKMVDCFLLQAGGLLLTRHSGTLWRTCYGQLGESPQYALSKENSINIAKKLELEGAELTFTGHSLGGGLAAANAMATRKDAITFNAAGVSDKTIKKHELFKKVTIDAYIVNGEILDCIQTPLGLKANGTIHVLPASYIPQIPLTNADDLYRTYQRGVNHMMEVVIDKLNNQ